MTAAAFSTALQPGESTLHFSMPATAQVEPCVLGRC